MSKRTFWLALVSCAALLVAGGLFASNMGFKLNYQLTGPGAFPVNGTNTISLPYNQQSGLLSAEDLGNDVGGFNAGGGGPVLQVAKYIKATDGIQSYTGGTGTDPDFGLDPGVGYRIQVNTDTSYIIVGSHKPGFAVALTGPGAFPVNGSNDYSYPYHSTSTTSQELGNDVGGFSAGGGGPVLQVAKYVKSTDGLQSYTGGTGTDPDFALIAGEAYVIQVNTDVNYVPSHF